VLGPSAQATGPDWSWPGPPAGPADWPQAMRGPHHQGVNRVETAITRETVGIQLRLAFDSRTGAQLYELRGNGWAAIPTVSNGRLFVSDGGKLVMLSLPASRASDPVRAVGRR
jgi:hypothetical protein